MNEGLMRILEDDREKLLTIKTVGLQRELSDCRDAMHYYYL